MAADGTITVTGVTSDVCEYVNGKLVLKDKKKTNPTIKVSKVDATDNKEIGGAKITVTKDDTDKTEVDSWTSKENESHEIKNVAPGNYILKEESAPEGYEKVDTEIKFSVAADGTITVTGVTSDVCEYVNGKLVLKDKKKTANPTVKVSKVDAGTGAEVPGATIVLKDKDGKVVEEWTSTKDAHEVTIPDGTYTLEETVAPSGYDKVDSKITFTVDKDGNVTLDSTVTTGVSEVKDGKILIKDSPIQKATGSLKITKTIEGPVTENDLTNLTFVVKASDGTVIFNGKLGEFEQENGKYVKTLSDLDTEKTYSVTETLFDVDGKTVTVTYSIGGGAETTGATASGVTVEADTTTTVDFRDVYADEEAGEKTEVLISKVEITGGPEIEGASLVITKDTKDGEVVKSWISGTAPHQVALLPGTYVLTETLVPDDFHLQAESITFTVNDDKTVTVNSEAAENNTIVMIDDVAGALRIVVEEEGTQRRIPDATVSVTTKKTDGTMETKEYKTDKNGEIYIPNLPTGNEYSYKVTKIPDGYKLTSVGEEKNVEVKAKEVTEKIEKIEVAEKKTEATTEAPTTEQPTTVTTEQPTTTMAEQPTTTSPTTDEDVDDDEDDDEDNDDDDLDDDDQETGTLIITVLDEKTNKPVPNAVVTVKNPDGTTGTYTTDDNGQIVLKDIPAGDYLVTVTKVPEGYEVTTGKTEKVTVKSGKTAQHTALINTSQTASGPNPNPGTSNSRTTDQRTSSVRTGDDTRVIPIIITMILSLGLIVTIVIRKKRMK